jgi:hypothetical protein
MFGRWLGLALLLILPLNGAARPSGEARQPAAEEESMGLQLTSKAFQQGVAIPSLYTCDGKDISPPLEWKDAPAGTKSFALICDDPDAPAGTWVHWVIYNIPPGATALREGMPKDAKLPDGSLHGVNDFGRTGYGGPCPPSGTHRYYFKLYALDSTLLLPPKASKQRVEEAMEGHLLAQAELMGTYRRSR